MQVISIILAILAFGVLVIVHEFGHFITAKRGGVQVNEFWIGMGPTILKHEHGGTLYCLKLLPFGGACVMEGEDGESENEHAFGKARLRRRILIVAAGALMNFAIGLLILVFAVQPTGRSGYVIPTVRSIDAGSSVLEGGIQEGDEILSIDGFRLLVRSDLNVALASSQTTSHEVKVRRDGRTVVLENVLFEARVDDGEGGKRIGITFAEAPATLAFRIKYAVLTALDDARLVWVSLGQLIGGLHRRTQGHARKHRALRRIAPPGGQHDHDRRLDHRRDPSGVDDPQTVERRRPYGGRRHAHAAAHLAGTGKRRRPYRGFRTGFRTNRIMEPQIYIAPGPFELETGHTLPELRIAYHTYGTLNAAKDNVAWVCHALTANSDVADWWPHTVEAGRFLDPARHFVVCANIIGSHYGTTGPLHVNPATGRPWYKDFPPFTIRDIVRAHRLLADALGIGRIGTLVGSSVGGFQAVEWAVSEPERIERLVLIATAAKASPWAIAIDETQRMAIEADTTFGQPRDDAGMKGLAAARAIGLLSYRGPEGYNLTQQDREERPAVHRACTYQQYQGEKLRRRYNAYSYYAILDAFDTHDAGRGRGGLEQALRSITARTLVVGITTDIIFTPAEMRSLHAMIPGSAYHEIDSPFGHDGFLVEHEQLNDILLPFMNN